ncbi:DDE_3 domain-containing protein [Trichonephila clavipes]|nr:DDE_3 domain-containing protein [Trichonephila clavipes]
MVKTDSSDHSRDFGTFGEFLHRAVHEKIHLVLFIVMLANETEDNAPLTVTGLVQSWFDEHEDEGKYLFWLAPSSYLNITEPLQSILERSMRNQYPLPASLPELTQYHYEEWYKIPL